MKKKLKTIFSLLFLTAVLILPYFVFADNSVSGQSTSPTDSGILQRLNAVANQGGYATGANSGLIVLVGTIIQAVLGLLGALFISFMIYAGFQWMTASGNESKIEKSQDTIRSSVIGLIITLSSWAIWSFIYSNFIVK